MTETGMRELLADVLLDDESGEVRNVESFETAGLMTSNEGLVVHMDDGTEFQLTIVQSR